MNKECAHCGMIHGPRCPSVKAIEFFPDGTVKRVEYVTVRYPRRYGRDPPAAFGCGVSRQWAGELVRELRWRDADRDNR